MNDPPKTMEELREENNLLKQRIKELERMESRPGLTEKTQRDSRKRIKSKSEPVGVHDVDLDPLELSEMINVPSIQALLEDFYKLNHLGLAILDLKGAVLISIGWQDICTRYHRVHPQTAAYCKESDLYLAGNVRQGEYVAYKCKNHLWDVVTPLFVGGKHVGNIYIGQFFYDDETIDMETFANQAKKYGFDKESYLAALSLVPRYSREQVTNYMDFLTKLSIMISELSYGNLKLARSVSRISGSLQESEERFRALVETTSDWIWETDARGVYTYASPKVKDILGYEPSEIVGRAVLDLMPPDEAKRVARINRDYFKKPKPMISYENLHFHKDGRIVVLETNGVPIVDENGRLRGYWGIDRDITQRKRAEEALRATFKAAPVGLSIVKNRVLQNVNQAWCDIVGYSETDIIGHTTRKLYEDKREYERVGRSLYPQLSEKGIASIQTKHRRKDGTFRDVVVTAALLRSEGTSLEAVVVVEDITDRRQKEEALKESEQALRTIFDNTHDAIFIHDLEGRILDCNLRTLDLYGVTREQALSMHILHDFSSAENRLEQEPDQWDRVMKGETITFEWKAKRPNDGSVFDVDVALKRIDLGIGPVILSNVRDITQRKAAEAALRESEGKFRALVEHCGDGILRFDRNHNCLYANRFVIEQTGLPLSPSDFIGKSFYELGFPRDLCDKWQENVERGFKSGEIIRHELQQPDGKWIDVIQIPEKDDSGQVKALISSARDITEHKQSEAMLSILFQAAPLAICVVDANRILTKVNDYCYPTFGYSPEEMVGRDPRFLYCNDEDYRAAGEAIYSADCMAMELRMRRKDGKEISALISRSYLNGKDISEGSIVVVQDVSDRKALEEQLRQAQKMEAIGQLAGGVAHDFNNMLQAILGYTNIILSSLGPEDRHYGKLMEVEKAGEKAAALTRQLLAFSRRQVLQLRPLDLNQVIEDLMKMLRRLIGENIELNIHADSALGKVNADRSQMEQVVINLCVNARDAMPDGGRLSIVTQNIRLDDDDCTKYDLEKPGRYVRLSVTDSGFGMEPETKSKIFEPFFTTKEKWRGTGLGLATVYGIVRQHDGMIQVDSELGKGSRFDVYLPVIESVEEAPLLEGQPPPRGGHETVLMAEDDAPLRFLTEEILKLAGYRVLVAVDGEDALRIYREHGQAVDLLLLDVIMPKKGGRWVYDEIRAVHPGIRCLFMSGYSEDAVHTNFILDHGLKLIQKPFKSMDLLRMLRQELDRS